MNTTMTMKNTKTELLNEVVELTAKLSNKDAAVAEEIKGYRDRILVLERQIVAPDEKLSKLTADNAKLTKQIKALKAAMSKHMPVAAPKSSEDKALLSAIKTVAASGLYHVVVQPEAVVKGYTLGKWEWFRGDGAIVSCKDDVLHAAKIAEAIRALWPKRGGKMLEITREGTLKVVAGAIKHVTAVDRCRSTDIAA